MSSPAIKRQIRAILIARARKGQPPITYADLCRQVPRAPSHRSPELYALLGEVSRQSYRKYGIFVTALVVSAGRGVPGAGFFTKLAIPIVGAIPNWKRFWKRERDRVYEFYARQERKRK